MEIVFLGTAGSFPTAKRALSSAAIRREGELILLDCGEGTQQRMTQAKLGFPSKMKILITHLHGDHILGIPGILQTMSLFNRKTTLDIYGPKGIYNFIKCIKETVKFKLTFPVEVHEVEEGAVYEGEEYIIQAVWVEHTIPCLAYALIENERLGRFYPEKAISLGVPEGPFWSRLQRGSNVKLSSGRVVKAEEVVGSPRLGRKIVYAVDTRPCDAVLKLAKDTDLLVYEATLSDDLAEKARDNYHSTPSQGAEIARVAGAKRLVLTHISGRYSDIDKFLRKAREIFPEVRIAKDLMVVEIPYSSS